MRAIRKILIVEDNPDFSQAMSDVLSDAGYLIQVASNGKEAIDQLVKDDGPELIILDLHLPVLSGSEFRKLQLQIPSIARIPVVGMSADCMGKRLCQHLGIQAFLKKPFELNELIFAIAAIGDTRLRPRAKKEPA